MPARLQKVESEQAIGNLEEAGRHVAIAWNLLRSVPPVNIYDEQALAEVVLELDGAFAKIDFLLTERGGPGVLMREYYDGIRKPSHSAAMSEVAR